MVKADVPDTSSELAQMLAHTANLLPAQGPITVFVHHNTLHTFEHLPFEEAVVEVGQLLGCAPFLSAARYRDELARGRIRVEDLRAVVVDALHARGDEPVGTLGDRAALWLAVMRRGLRPARGTALRWILTETPALSRLRDDIHSDARERFMERAGTIHGRDLGAGPLQAKALGILWRSCLAAADRANVPPPEAPPPPIRHRDLLLACHHADIDRWVHPLLIRLTASFLDQGVAYWPMPDRDLGFLAATLSLYGQRFASPLDPWMRHLPETLRAEAAAGRSALDSIAHSLCVLGVGRADQQRYLTATALALRGFAGMMHQLEVRPDRVPVRPVLARFADFMAVRLLLERVAVAHAASTTPTLAAVDLATLGAHLRVELPDHRPPTRVEYAWQLFQVAQVRGRTDAEIDLLDAEAARAVLLELRDFDDIARRRLLHQAYERRYRREVRDALIEHTPADPVVRPDLQAIFCVDEREESLRRHLEEVHPTCETFGLAGYFGVAMYYAGAIDAHPRPLCPVSIRPQHIVAEAVSAPGATASLRGGARHAYGRLGKEISIGSRTLVRGALISAGVGALAALPLALRVLSPRVAAWLVRRRERALGPGGTTRLLTDYQPGAAEELGARPGFTKQEMADIVERQLQDIGICGYFAPLVLAIGHGSASMNNPHEAAHDCGACGGGRGGPNARAFAQMANDPEVRRLLAARGLKIPETTWFIGGEHNTCDNAVPLFDLDQVPATHRAALANAQRALDSARARDAHERCRRFEAAPRHLTSALALAHVASRTADLAQPRPEYGHATNAFCVVGRRQRTRGLFLDRRAFLMSYDPTQDDVESTVLTRVLESLVPVVAGINLEYYFSYVDPVGYGSGTKLPHNVTALLGVMDGHASDLRTGLPWQMVEVHEPVRMLMVVETTPATLERIFARLPALDRLVSNRWIFIATIDPDSDLVCPLGPDGFVPHQAETETLPQVASSAAWYAGRSDHLPFATIAPGSPTGRAE